jgi:hypothetical protein
MHRYPAFRAGLLVLCVVWLTCERSSAAGIVRQPGDHPHYSVELEPHLVWTWGWLPYLAHDGVGVGLRASIPLFHNGPIDTINNNMAISFGFDWAHSGAYCGPYGRPPPGYPPGYVYYYGYDNCTANGYWFPVALQWNFFLTPVVSVFGEAGVALVHERWNQWVACPAGAGPCEYGFSNTDVHPVFWGGARFLFSDTLGVTVRLGAPSVSAGLTVLL